MDSAKEPNQQQRQRKITTYNNHLASGSSCYIMLLCNHPSPRSTRGSSARPGPSHTVAKLQRALESCGSKPSQVPPFPATQAKNRMTRHGMPLPKERFCPENVFLCASASLFLCLCSCVFVLAWDNKPPPMTHN